MNNHDSVVFIVDDDDSLRRGLERLLRVTGHNVESFSSAAAFLERPDPDSLHDRVRGRRDVRSWYEGGSR